MIELETMKRMHTLAGERFKADPSKCYQRHVREVWGEAENKPQLLSLAGAKVEQITREEAESIILKYEYLAGKAWLTGEHKSPMGRGIEICYGLRLNGELLGANCLGSMGGKIGNICGPTHAKETGYLMRGACVPHAPKNSASFLTAYTCKQALKDKGWKIFFAYSDDEDASEVGTIYQACNWYYLGKGIGSGAHYDYMSPDGGKLFTSYQLNHQGKDKKLLRGLGWVPEKGEMRPWLRAQGWKEISKPPKHKWVWFEGTPEEKKLLLGSCRHPILPKDQYPKRKEPCTQYQKNLGTPLLCSW